MMLHLINDFSEVNGYLVSKEYFATSSKHDIRLYEAKRLEFIGSLLFNRFPKIIQFEQNFLLVRDQKNFLKIDYSLHKNEVFEIDVPNVWMIHYLEDDKVIIKRKIDRADNDFHVLKYDLKENEVIWESMCNNYKLPLINSSYIILDGNNLSSLQCMDTELGEIRWRVFLKEIFSELYTSDNGRFELKAKPVFHRSTVIIHVQQVESGWRYLAGLDIHTGKLKWHKRDYSNFELYNGKLYNLEFYGLFRVLDPETGEVEREEDLKPEFERMDINCEHRFNVTDNHLYFKHAIKGKFGILNLKTLKVEEAHQLPDGNTMSTEEYPIPVDDRLYIRSAPQNNLFIYQRE